MFYEFMKIKYAQLRKHMQLYRTNITIGFQERRFSFWQPAGVLKMRAPPRGHFR